MGASAAQAQGREVRGGAYHAPCLSDQEGDARWSTGVFRSFVCAWARAAAHLLSRHAATGPLAAGSTAALRGAACVGRTRTWGGEMGVSAACVAAGAGTWGLRWVGGGGLRAEGARWQGLRHG